MADPVKRLHYFNGEFLRAGDFIVEQEYHLQMGRLHNRLLHTWGIADGLKVEIEPGGAAITVRPGAAYDGQGRAIVLAEEQQKDTTSVAAGPFYVTIAYAETETDPTNETGAQGNTRWTEAPAIELSATAPTDPSQKLVLARVSVVGEERIVDESERRLAGVVGGDLEVRSLVLAHPDVAPTQWPRLSTSGANRANLSSNLNVIGDIGVQRDLSVTRNSTMGGNLSIAGDVTAQRDLTITRNNTVGGALSVTGDGTLQRNLTVARDVKIGSGLSVGKDVSADGAGLFAGNVGVGTTTPENSDGWNKVLDILGAAHAKLSVRTAAIDARIMAHATGFWGAPAGMILGVRTAHPVSIGTNATSRLTIDAAGNVGIGTATPAGSLHLAASAPSLFLLGPTTADKDGLRVHYNEAASLRAGVIDVKGLSLRLRGESTATGTGATDRLYIDLTNGNVGIGTTTPGFKLDVADRMRVKQGTGGTAGIWFLQSTPNNDRAFVGMASDTQVGFWGNTGAQWGLLMDTTTGDVNVKGKLTATKIGYVTDQFVNNLGETLEEGDVVVISTNQASLYYGANNNIPIPEVDLAQRAYDTRLCGIVDEVYATLDGVSGDVAASSPQGKKSRKKKASEEQRSISGLLPRPFTEDERAALERTKIAPGQIGGMVTLGAYAHCKVDADIAPIQVGDLLTTSPTKGHAQKVLDPTLAIGAILGKALGSLASGKGKIPVMVQIQ